MSQAINPCEKHEDKDKAYTDHGFTVEHKGEVTIYRRPVSDDTFETARRFAYKRTIGYRSKDISPPNK